MEGVLDMVSAGEVSLPVVAGEQLPVDLLGRQELVDRIMELLNILSSTRGSCTFALNGKWGSGKTFLLNMLERQLREYQAGEKYTVFHYNCWEYDYYEEPLIAIVAAMLDGLDEETQLIPEVSRDAFKRGIDTVKPMFEKIMASFAKNKLGIDIADILSLANEMQNGAKEADKKINEKYDYDQYYGFKKAIRTAKEGFQQLTGDKTAVVVVDELDRCLPGYAIKVLERLHHLFYGMENMVVILAVDKSQMGHSVEQIFGKGTDASAYLKKFINFELTLNTGKVEGEKFREKYADYLDLFDETLIESDIIFDEFVSTLFDGIDARTQERLIERITTVHRMLFPNQKKDYSFMFFELMLIVFNHVHPLLDNIFAIEKSYGYNIRVTLAEMGCPKFTSYMNNIWKCVSAREDDMFDYVRGGKSFYLSGKLEISEMLLFYLASICNSGPSVNVNLESEDGHRCYTNWLEIKKVYKLFQVIK